MDRKALQGLSREELIELVIRLGEMVVAAGQQPQRLAEPERQLAELQADVQRLSTPPKTSATSSVPPPVGFKANRAERRRRRGKRRGHPGTSRRRHAFVSRNGAGRELQAGKSPRAAMSCGPGKRQIR